MPNLEECPECENAENEEMVACHKCDQWFHFECVNLNGHLVDKISEFYCVACELSHGIMTIWKKFRANSARRAEKRKFYFDVEEIVRHRIRKVGTITSRMFFIKWKGYPSSQNTWEAEHHLDGCIDLLQKYLRENGLPYSMMDGLVGTSSTDISPFNEKNWSSIFDIIALFQKIKEFYYPQVDLSCEKWVSFKTIDQLFFLKFESHCFVILYYAKSRSGYIADGGNLFRTDESVSKSVRSLLKIKLRSCEFNQQTEIDHCGSSAVLIGLEMMRAYKSGLRPGKLICPSSWKKKVIKQLHKFKSQTMDLPALHKFQQRLECTRCGKRYRGTQRRNYYQHLAKCSK